MVVHSPQTEIQWEAPLLVPHPRSIDMNPSHAGSPIRPVPVCRPSLHERSPLGLLCLGVEVSTTTFLFSLV